MVNYRDFVNKTNNNEIFGAYLFQGNDAFFLEHGLSLLSKKIVSDFDFDYAVFDENSFSHDAVMASLNTFSMFGGKRLTVVKEFYPDKKDFSSKFKGLKTYLDNPFNDSVLAIVNSEVCESLKQFSNLNVVDCNKQSVSDIVKWIKIRCEENDVKIDAESASLISNYCLDSMTRVETETIKLIDYAGNGGTITIEDVKNLVSKGTDYKVYQMTDYIARRKFDLALDVIVDMLSEKDSVQPVISAVYKYFRKMLHIAISDKSDLELSKLLGMQEYAIKKTREVSRNFKKKSLKKAIDMLVDCDYLSKSGKIDGFESMWITIFKIMTEE